MKHINGIGDASEFDTNLRTDWTMAAQAGIEWALVRACTTSISNTGRPYPRADRMFSFNVAGCQKSGIHMASYAWFDPRIAYCPSYDQANVYCDIVEAAGGPGSFGPVIDIEDSGGIVSNSKTGEHILAWLQIVENRLKVRPRIYTNLDYTSRYLFNSTVRYTWLTQYEIIIASWQTAAPIVPQPWAPETWRAWQYRSNAPGAYYGFVGSAAGRPAPLICMAIWRSDD